MAAVVVDGLAVVIVADTVGCMFTYLTVCSYICLSVCLESVRLESHGPGGAAQNPHQHYI